MGPRWGGAGPGRGEESVPQSLEGPGGGAEIGRGGARTGRGGGGAGGGASAAIPGGPGAGPGWGGEGPGRGWDGAGPDSRSRRSPRWSRGRVREGRVRGRAGRGRGPCRSPWWAQGRGGARWSGSRLPSSPASAHTAPPPQNELQQIRLSFERKKMAITEVPPAGVGGGAGRGLHLWRGASSTGPALS